MSIAPSLQLLAVAGLSITHSQMKGFEMSIVYSSLVLYLAEAVTFWLFILGLAWCVRRLVSVLNASGSPTHLGAPGVDSRLLVRFMWFQIVFVAVWSICFKAALYTSLLPWYSHRLLSKGQSLGIAIPAEVVALLLCLIGFTLLTQRWLSRARWGVE